MQLLYEVRKEYGDVFVTAFDDGLCVPWRLLTIQEYIKLKQDWDRGLIPYVQLEDEVFKKCVTDDTLVRQIDFLKAGVIYTVVQNIWQYSGPSSVQSFNNDIEIARSLLSAPGVQPLHFLVKIITQAFPYKPEEVYAMSYDILLIRAAQAEEKLMEAGLLTEPISMHDSSQEEEVAPSPQPTKSPVDAKKLWEEQEQQRRNLPKPKPTKERVSQEDKWWNESPVLESKKKHNIDFDAEGGMQYLELEGHEKTDFAIERDKMVKSSRVIYKDLIEKLNKERSG